MQLQHTIKAVVRCGDNSGYVAECLEIHAVTQGMTLDETIANPHEVASLRLGGEDFSDLSIGVRP